MPPSTTSCPGAALLSPAHSAPQRRWLTQFLTLLLPVLAACRPVATAPQPTATLIPPSPTPTILFPTIGPTSTETIITQEPPPNPLADAGAVLYATEFSDAAGWQLGRDSLGATSLIDETLSLVVPRPGLTRIARSPAPVVDSSFILDASLRSEVCVGNDEYGLVFRLGQEGDHLRFTVTCQGGVRLRRVLKGASRALVPFVATDPAVMAGAPARNRLTVRALGDDLRLFVNDVEVLRARAPTLPPGGFGLVVASEGAQGQTTVTVDSFTLYQLPLAPSASATAD